MSPEAVQAILADLERHSARVALRADGRETWRFRIDGAGLTYDLHFYPDDDTALKRYLGGAAAAREFAQLQSLQKLKIPATRVIANLKGLRLGDRKGDACIVVHDVDALPLDAILRRSAALSYRDRLTQLASLIARLEALHREKLCPTPLVAHLFSHRGDKTLLSDGSAVLAGIVDADRLNELDASTRHVTTASERLRTWRHFTDDPPPRDDRALMRTSRQIGRDALAGAGWFGAIDHDGWSGRFLRRPMLTLPWYSASDLEFSQADFLAALPDLLQGGTGHAIKDDDAASVVARTITLAGRSLEVIIKRPTFKPGLRGIYRSYRWSRARRAWFKTWRMLALGFTCEVPLLMLERRRALRLVEQIFVVERVPGATLAAVDLDALQNHERQSLLYASGRTLRLIERAGFSHWDAKATNWIVWSDAAGHLKPVLIDLDGIRFYRGRGIGIRRLQRAMGQHPEASRADVEALAKGYSRAR